MTHQDTMRLALEALETCSGVYEQEFDAVKVDESIEALKAALSQQGEQRPIASLYIGKDGDREIDDWKCELPAGRYELYAGAAPAAQPDARKVVEQMVRALDYHADDPDDFGHAARQAGQQWLEENK